MHWKEHTASYYGIKLPKRIITFTPLHLLILLDFSPLPETVDGDFSGQLKG